MRGFDIEYDILNEYKGRSTDVTVPEGVEVIGEFAFERKRTMKRVTLPDSVRRICDGAFFKCYDLESVTLSENTEWIDQWAFLGCFSLTTVTLTPGRTAIPAQPVERLVEDAEELRSIRVIDTAHAVELLSEFPAGTRPHALLLRGLLELAEEDPSILRSEFLLKGPLFEELLAYAQEHMPPLAAELLRARYEIMSAEEDGFTL